MNEDLLLATIDIERALALLEEPDRVMIEMFFRYRRPATYGGRWPPSFPDIADYIGITYRGQPLSEATIRYRIAQIHRMWRGERGQLRSQPPKPDQLMDESAGLAEE